MPDADQDAAPGSGTTYVLIWSNQQTMWWRANRRGYTRHIDEAGRYPLAEAQRIVADATCNGALGVGRADPATGGAYVEQTEVLVPAPEALQAAPIDRLAAALSTAVGHGRRLSATIADLDRVVDQRAQALANNRIATAKASAAGMVARAEADQQQQRDLVSELRRILAATDRARDLARAERDQARAELAACRPVGQDAR
jgi:hypothetical protein